MTRRAGSVVPLSVSMVAIFVALQTAPVPTQTPAPGPTLYGVQGFGPAGALSAANDVSDFGSPIVGRVRSTNGAERAAIWWYNGYRELGTLGGAQSTALGASYSIVVGQAQTASGPFHAFRADLSTNGTPQLVDLGTLGGSSSVAYATDGTNVVGSAQVTGNSRWQAFIWTNGLMSALPVRSQGNSSAIDVLDDQVVGYACASGDTSCRGFWVKAGAVTMLPTLGGNTRANAINGWEQVVGGSVLPSGARHAFLYDQGAIVDLQTLGGKNSEALDINDSGHIVGVSDTASSQQHAFVYRDGAMTDLNTLLPSGSGWVLRRATGISAGGQIVGVGTFNGQSRGFVLTPPADVFVWQGGMLTGRDSNLPRDGVEVGKRIRFVNAVWATPDPLTVYGVRITATLIGPAEYEAPVDSYGTTDGTECQVTPKTITCDVPSIDTVHSGIEFWFTVRATGPGSISHRVIATSDIPDPDSENNSLIEENRAVALANLALTPATIPGGKVSAARVTLTDIAPWSNGARVRMTSSRPDIAPVPPIFVVPSPNTHREFNIRPAVVAQPTPVVITATYGQVTLKQTLTVVPPALTQLYLTPTTVSGGCGTSAGKVVLSGSAPPGGAVVSLTNTNRAAIAPPTITIPAGASSQTFTITTKTVTTNVSGTVTTSYAGASKGLAFTVRPIRVKSLTLSPNPVTGGSTSTGSVALECPAPPGGTTVTLSSTNGAVAVPAVTTISIPAGATVRSFTVRTSRVSASTNVTIYATAYGVRKGASLTVRP